MLSSIMIGECRPCNYINGSAIGMDASLPVFYFLRVHGSERKTKGQGVRHCQHVSEGLFLAYRERKLELPQWILILWKPA